MAEQESRSPETGAEIPASITVKTLFGDMELMWDKAIYFPAGIRGFPEHTVFALARFPDAGNGNFILLQSMTEPELAFIIAPYNMDSNAIHPDHIDQAFTIHGINRANGALFLIVSIIRGDDGHVQNLSVNLRAPIVVDIPRQTAYQQLFPAIYPYHHEIAQ